jgi:transposase
MRYVGIDLHKRFLVACVQDDVGSTLASERIDCSDVGRIAQFFDTQRPFRAVIEASSSYRWLYDLLSARGEVVLAHPLQLRAIVAGRAKTDKLDAALLAKLLRAGLIPESYVPPVSYQHLRDLTRARARLSRQATAAKNEMHALLGRRNIPAPFVVLFGPRGRRWLTSLDLGPVDGLLRDELLARLDHYDAALALHDRLLNDLAEGFPQVEALTCLYGIGVYSALLIVAEIGEPGRFSDGRKVGAYAGLTARVNQSGGHCYTGHITRQGSPWLRWILVQAAMKLVRRDGKLGNFYQRIRKRSGVKVARVAAARKLAEICWLRLMRWHRTAVA